MTDYQVMPELDDDEFSRLKEDIAENGIEYPIIVDGDGNIIDGHHRKQAWEELGRVPDELPTRVVDESDTDNYHRAYRANLLRRDLTDGTKKKVVKQYLLEHPERVQEDSEREIASDLGVSQYTVNQARQELEESGKLNVQNQFTTDEKKQQVRAYLNQNPNASNREVAREVECDVTHVTVGNWRNEWGDTEEPSTGLDTFTQTSKEKESALEITEKAKSKDEEVAQTAKEEASKVVEGKSPTSAAKEVEKTEVEKEVEEQRDIDESGTALVTQADANNWLPNTAPNADLLLTDPPFDTDVDDVVDFAEQWVPKALESVKSDGYAYIFIGSYTDELYAYTKVLRESDFHTQPLVWNYRNTLGQSPSDRYKRDWQAIMYCRGPDAGDLNAPKTSELRSVQRINAPGMVGDDSERFHKWQKPSELIEMFVRHTTDEGDTVIDPFAGSGEHILTASDLGRDAYGCDLDESAIETAVNRGCDHE